MEALVSVRQRAINVPKYHKSAVNECTQVPQINVPKYHKSAGNECTQVLDECTERATVPYEGGVTEGTEVRASTRLRYLDLAQNAMGDAGTRS